MRIELDIELAMRDDLADGNTIRDGALYFIQSMITGKIEGPYRLHALMSLDEQLQLKEYLDHHMLYVPKINREQHIKTIAE